MPACSSCSSATVCDLCFDGMLLSDEGYCFCDTTGVEDTLTADETTGLCTCIEEGAYLIQGSGCFSCGELIDGCSTCGEVPWYSGYPLDKQRTLGTFVDAGYVSCTSIEDSSVAIAV